MINIYFSDAPNNFRNIKYIECMEEEFKKMFRAYHKYISYRNKLLYELTLNSEQRERMEEIDERFVKNLKRASKRIERGEN